MSRKFNYKISKKQLKREKLINKLFIKLADIRYRKEVSKYTVAKLNFAEANIVKQVRETRVS